MQYKKTLKYEYNPNSHLARKTVSVDVVLAALAVLRAVVNVNLLELIAIGERTARDVDVLLGVLVNAKHQRLAGVVQHAGNL